MENMETFINMVIANLRLAISALYNDTKVPIIIEPKITFGNNGVQQYSIIARYDNQKARINICIDNQYEDYRNGTIDIPEIVENILNIIFSKQNGKNVLDTITEPIKTINASVMDWDFAKENVVAFCVNAEYNAELLKNVPHKCKEDLAFIYKIISPQDSQDLQEPELNYLAAIITNEMLVKWGISEEELYQAVEKNTLRMMQFKVTTLLGLLADFNIDTPIHDDVPPEFQPYVIVDKSRTNGAASMMYPKIFADIADKLNTDIYLLPSSTHEIIIMDAQANDAKKIADMVQDVNMTEVALEDKLSDHVYLFSREAGDWHIIA